MKGKHIVCRRSCFRGIIKRLRSGGEGNSEDPAFQLHTYDFEVCMISTGSIFAELDIYIFVLTNVGLDEMTGELRK
jgi:hypothetical protein